MNVQTHRRNLHQIPELDLRLDKTMAYLKSALQGMKCRVFSPMESALCAWFDFGSDKAIAFRADADALPIQEASGVPYASTHPGQMHACGHDGHMAIVLELARRLDRTEKLGRNVLLVFQPAEETIGGARQLCDTGVFGQYRVEAIFGLHLWPGLPFGTVASRKNELMARSCEVNVDILGRSAHIAKAAQGLDAMAAGLEFYRRAVEMEQKLPRDVFRLLKFGRMESGHVRNAISDRTRLEGSLRAFQDEVFFGMRDSLFAIARDIQAETGCRVEITTSSGYPAVMNPPQLYDFVRRHLPVADLPEPSMTSEDYSWYQRHLPGLFFFLGVGDTPALHASNFDFDDSVLEKGADFFESIAKLY